jgi:radical SAM protein with 4Fe4S-binding SPASM domain
MSVKKPEIVFLYPVHNTGYLLHHLGASYIIAYLRQEGILAQQFINTQPLRIAELARQILNTGADILGFTCYDQNYFFIKLFVKYLKEINPGIFIIVGGPTATFSDKIILKNIPGVNLCVRGEGEYTVYELISHLRSDSDFSKVAGITYRRGRRIIRNADRPLLQNEQDKNAQLDIIPSPYLSGILDSKQLLTEHESIPIITSRGCIYRCTYCNFTAISKYTVRYHSVKRVTAELKIVNKLTGPENKASVTFYDDCFTLNNQRVRQICDSIIRENINLDIRINTRADYVNEEILRLLFKAGFSQIHFGLESASPGVLYDIKKVRLSYLDKDNFEPEKKFVRRVEKAVRMAKRIGFKVSASIILGLPGENFKDGLKTINLIKRLGLDYYYHNYLHVFSGTELFKKIVKGGSDTSESIIRQSMPVLKNNIYLYDVSEIPEYPNALRGKNEKLKALSVDLALSLSGVYWNGENKNTNPDIILTAEKIPVNALIKNIPLESEIFFGKNIGALFGKSESEMEIYGLRLAQMLGIETNIKRAYFSKGQINNRLPLKEDYEFKKFIFYSDFLKSSYRPRNIILGILDNPDADAFEKILAHMQISSYKDYTNSENNFILLDACRWSDSCPAKNMERLIVDKNLDILPCFQGKILGQLGHNLNEIRNNYIKYWRQETKKRGCRTCSARSSCSQCPFLGDIDPATYCKIKKKYPIMTNKFAFLLQTKAAMQLV